jgi:hypothetical protein
MATNAGIFEAQFVSLIAAVPLTGLFLAPVVTPILMRYLDRGLLKAFGISLAASIIGVVTFFYAAQQSNMSGKMIERNLLMFSGKGLIMLFVVPFAFNLYRKWVLAEMSDAEKQANGDGIRAWLSLGNIVCCLGIAVLAMTAYSMSFLTVLLATLALTVAYPIILMLDQPSAVVQQSTDSAGPPSSQKHHENLNRERDKILALLENGKITPEESAELLNALSTSSPLSARANDPLYRMIQENRLVVLGSLLLLVGFFLPWFSFSPQGMMQQAQNQMNNMMGNTPMGKQMAQLNIINFSGADIQHGLGILVLLMALAALALQAMDLGLSAINQRKATIITLAVGTITIFFVFAKGVSGVSYGLIVVLIGYLLEWAGVFKTQKSR